MIRALRLPQMADQLLQRAFDEVSQVLNLIRYSKILDGQLVTGVALVAGVPKAVPHGLDRVPYGFVVVRKRAAADISDQQDTNATPDRTFALLSSANCTADIWFF